MRFHLFCRKLYHMGFFEWIFPILTFLMGLLIGAVFT